MEKSIVSIDVLRSLDFRPLDFISTVGEATALIFGEYHPLSRPKQIITGHITELARTGFTHLCLEGVPYGVIYDGTQKVELFCRAHFGQKDNIAATIEMVQAAVDHGIQVVGIDMQPGEEQHLFDQLEQLQAGMDSTKRRMTQFMALIPLLLRGVDLDSDMPILQSKGIHLTKDEIRAFATDPAAAIAELKQIATQTAELNKAHVDFIVDHRDQIMAENFLRVLDTHKTKGILHIGLHHCRFTPTSSAQRVVQSGVQTRTFLLTNALTDYDPTTATYLAEREIADQDVMMELDENTVLINLPEKI